MIDINCFFVSVLSLIVFFLHLFLKIATRKPAQKINVWLQWTAECQSVPEAGINLNWLKVFCTGESEEEFRIRNELKSNLLTVICGLGFIYLESFHEEKLCCGLCIIVIANIFILHKFKFSIKKKHSKIVFNSLQPSVAFLYPLKTSENL